MGGIERERVEKGISRLVFFVPSCRRRLLPFVRSKVAMTRVGVTQPNRVSLFLPLALGGRSQPLSPLGPWMCVHGVEPNKEGFSGELFRFVSKPVCVTLRSSRFGPVNPVHTVSLNKKAKSLSSPTLLLSASVSQCKVPIPKYYSCRVKPHDH